MQWNKGFSAQYFITQVDPKTWGDMGSLRATSGSISRDGDSTLINSADLSLDRDPGEIWVRVYLYANQNGSSAREALFTGLTSTPNNSVEGWRVSHDVTCYSVLKPCSDVLLDIGWYTPKGMFAIDLVADLLSVSPAPIKIINKFDSPVLADYIVAESGESNLSMAVKILSAIGWTMGIDGSGVITIHPVQNVIKATFDGLNNDIIEPSFSNSNDWYSCPNVFRAVSDNECKVIRDTDINSKLSIPSRGREIWAEETIVTLVGGESLEQYAWRRLKELQSPSHPVTYSRRFVPNVYPGDLVRILYPGNKLNGIFMVKSQSIELSHAATTEETVSEA